MAILLVYIGAAVAFVLGVTVYLMAFSVDHTRVLGTPSIPAENGILTSYGSATIHATVDEVFTALTRFDEYTKWSSFNNYMWEDTTANGVPAVGSKGRFQLNMEGFAVRTIPVKLTLLDKEKKIIAVKSTGYPTWALSSEWVQEVIPIDGHDNLCEYRAWHTIEGVAAYVLILLAQEELAFAMRGSANRLKAFIERK